jgi:sugar O-acyltransferase (sialic acid O-acetyltransferase NeuD family)
MSKIVVFGAGQIAEIVYHYISGDSSHEIVAFTVDADRLKEKEFLGRPIVAFEEVEKLYPTDQYEMFIALAYNNLNQLRAEKYQQAKDKGYQLASYVSSKASLVGPVEIGENCFILENQTLQFAKIGNNVTIWSGNHIGHHSTIGDHTWISSAVCISGNVTIEPYCFVGVNATLGNNITIGKQSFIGAGALITKDVEEKSVFIQSETKKYALDSTRFIQLSKML